ncbi:MAG TPA: SRPBCC family protein [Dehalococcoidia bacterium]|nr:SRPBCC family protein [Dehalococcoidia bacterium]
MAVFSQETTINRSPEDVFAYVSDMNRHGEWGGHELEVKQTSTGPIGVGATFSSLAKQFGTQRETQTVTEYAPGKRFVFEANGSLGIARHVFELTPSGSGTHVLKSMELTKPSFLARLMSMKIKGDQAKALTQDLQRIKQKLEA